MRSKEVLLNLIEREREHCEGLEIGSEKYIASFNRLTKLEELLSDLEKAEREKDDAKKARVIQTILECVKIGCNVTLPLIGYVVLVAAEKEITFTGALRDVTKCFLPKQMR